MATSSWPRASNVSSAAACLYCNSVRRPPCRISRSSLRPTCLMPSISTRPSCFSSSTASCLSSMAPCCASATANFKAISCACSLRIRSLSACCLKAASTKGINFALFSSCIASSIRIDGLVANVKEAMAYFFSAASAAFWASDPKAFPSLSFPISAACSSASASSKSFSIGLF